MGDWPGLEMETWAALSNASGMLVWIAQQALWKYKAASGQAIKFSGAFLAFP